ncbi:hypothetical protein ES703_126067 [subsurface metagenome]
MFTAKLRKDLENIVMDAIAEWEYQKHVIAYYTFEINAIDLITEDLSSSRRKSK